MAEKQRPIELNKNDPESLYNWIAYKVSCPEFRNPIKNFIDENCSTFVDIDENSFEQGQLFNEMNLLLENLLKDVLDEGQITQEDFLKAAERGITDKKHKKYFNQIINFGDYTFFKSVMTKRNYQIIQMAEKQMNQEKEMENKNMEGMEGEGKAGLPPEIVAQMLENEQTEINEAIKQSLADEDEKRRIAIIEEEEMKRAIKQSLEQQKKEQKKKEETKKDETKKDETKKQEPKKVEPKKEEPKKEEPKKEEPKKEETKKEEPKKFEPSISSVANFQYSGEEKPKENKPNPTVISANKGYQFQVSSRAEEFGVRNEPKEEIYKTPTPNKESEPKKEEKKPIQKKNIENDEKKLVNKTPENEIIMPKKQERITRDFVNVFEEKKLTLAPLLHKSNLSNPYKSSLKQDLEKSQKGNVQKDIEKMNKKAEEKKESAKDIIKQSMQSSLNKNDINFMVEDDGLLIDEDEDDDVVFQNNKNDSNTKSHNIHFGKIAIPKDFNDKIPDYNKEKEEQLKEYREKVLKMKKDEREQKMNFQ